MSKNSANNAQVSDKSLNKTESASPVKSFSAPVTEEVSTLNLQAFITPATVLLSAVMISLAIFFTFKDKTIVEGALPSSNTGDGTTATEEDVKVDINAIKALFKKDDVIKFGNEKEKVLFVEFSDPSCPYCSIASGENSELNKQNAQFTLVKDGGKYVAPVPEMKKMVQKGDASFIYMYTNGHGNGEVAAQALYCAYEDDKNKFWEVHDKIMSADGYNLLNGEKGGSNMDPAVLAEFLKPVFDYNKMYKCLSEKKYASRLTRDQQEGKTLGVQGTPGFFVNTTIFRGAYSFTDMQSAVDAAKK